MTVEGGDWSYVNLRGADLSGLDLTGVRLVEADLSEADLRGTVLRYCDLTRAVLRNVTLDGADLVGADLSERRAARAGVEGRPGRHDAGAADRRGRRVRSSPAEHAR